MHQGPWRPSRLPWSSLPTLRPSTLDPSLPLLHEGKSDHALDGYSVEHHALWTTDGRLVAEHQQVFAIIR